MGRTRKALRNLALVARTVVGHRYPDFVYGRPVDDEEMPVFFYHDVGPEPFRRDLEYLRANGYETIGCDGVVARARGASGGASHQVSLTFDDGLKSLYDTAYPLLLEFGFRAVAYIVPAYVGEPGFVTWAQCAEMYDSGVVEIQSHSFAHCRVVTHLRPIDVWERTGGRHVWEVSGLCAGPHAGPAMLPILPGGSLYSIEEGIRLPQEFWDSCTELTTPGDPRHRRPVTKEAARTTFLTLLSQHEADAQHLDSDSIRSMVRSDLQRSADVIEAHLQGHRVKHFAFPWHRHHPVAWEALEQAGFQSAAIGLGVQEGEREPGRHHAVVQIRRVRGDFLRSLPGAGRRPLWRILASKASRRASPKRKPTEPQ